MRIGCADSGDCRDIRAARAKETGQHEPQRGSGARRPLLTTNLSETVERLLAEYVEAEQAKRAEKERLIDATIEMAKAHYAEHGLWGEEYATL